MVVAVYFTAKIGKLLDKWEIEETFMVRQFFQGCIMWGEARGTIYLITIKRCIFDIGNLVFK